MSYFTKPSAQMDSMNPYAITPDDPRPRFAHYALYDGRPYVGPMNHQFTPEDAMYTGVQFDYTSQRLYLLPKPMPLDYSVPEPERAPQPLRNEFTVFAPGYGIPESTLFNEPEYRQGPFIPQRFSMDYNPGFQGAQSIPPSALDSKQLVRDGFENPNPRFIVQRIGTGREIYNPMAPAKPRIALPEMTDATAVKIEPRSASYAGVQTGDDTVTVEPVIQTSTPAPIPLTITGVPVVQDNPNPSPFIFNSDPSPAKAITEAGRIRIEQRQALVKFAKDLVPAFLQERTREIAVMMPDNLLPAAETIYLESLRRQLRSEFIQVNNIDDSDFKNIFLIDIRMLRDILNKEKKRREAREVEASSATVISARFRGRRARTAPVAPEVSQASSSTTPPATVAAKGSTRKKGVPQP